MKMQITRKIKAVTMILAITLSLTICAGFSANSAIDTETIVSQIVAEMTLKQRIAQMIMPDLQSWTDSDGNDSAQTELNPNTAQAIKELGFAGVILFAENCAGTQQTAELVCDLQQSATAEDSVSKLPMLIAIDQEGGLVTRLATGTKLPGNMAIGASNNIDNARLAGTIIGSELNALGINVDFAPDMDINTNPANSVIGTRSFSSKPQMVADFGKAYIDGLHSQKIASSVKHFLGHGDTAIDSHSGLPCIDKTYEQLSECELIPFMAGINSYTDIVVTAHIQYPQIENETYTSKSTGEQITLPATLSKKILKDILRDELGFKGIICTDALNMGAITEHFTTLEASRLAINAGANILLMPVSLSSENAIENCKSYINSIEEMTLNGEIDEDKITESAEKIVKLKLDRGIDKQDGSDKENIVKNALAVVGSEEHHNLEFELAKKAVTMVQNDNSALPIAQDTSKKTAIFCDYPDEIVSAEFAIEHLKKSDIIPQDYSCDIFWYNGKTTEHFSKEIADADNVIVISEIYSEDNLNNADAEFIDSLISKVHNNNGKITVISALLPYDVARYQNADALLLTYGADGMSEIPNEFNGEVKTYGPNIPASICIAFGEAEPTGNLPVDIMRLDTKNKYSDEVLYHQGYGMINWKGETGTTVAPTSSEVQSEVEPTQHNENTNTSYDSFMSTVIIVAVVFAVAGIILITVLVLKSRKSKNKNG